MLPKVPPKNLAMSSDQRWKLSRSSGAIPNISAMTMAGSGWAKSATRSIWPMGLHPVEQFLRDFLDDWPPDIERTLCETLARYPAQTGVQRDVLHQHPPIRHAQII